jgi:CPA2 family monovalent cation:H+ antiporter-2
MDFVADLTLVLVAALMGGYLAQRFGQPLIVGYIVAGVVVGPFTGGPTVGNVQVIEQLAELGVALLLFSLGLELSFRDLVPVRNVALIGGAIQIVLTISVGVGLGTWLGWEWRPALWFGALVSLSSTMVALKTIQSQGRLGTLSSRVMLGLLVVQDLAVVPLMIVLPELSDPAGGGIAKIGVAAMRAILLLAVIVFFSTRVVPRLLAYVASRNSHELFFLSTTTLAVGVGYAASRFGLSMALGAFVAGLVVNESEYAHQALSDIVPLRDLFGMLFFVSVGMLLEPAFVVQHAGTLVVVILAVALGKGAILAGIVRWFGYRNVVPLAVGMTLFQVGEFAFVLARVGRSSGGISADVYALTLNTAIVTMTFTPVVSSLVPALYERFWPRRSRETHEAINVPSAGLSRHVVIAGSGRVGSGIAEALSDLGLPFVLVESDDRRVQQARAAGFPVIYGDATQPIVLEAASVQRARAILITVPTFADVRSIVRAGRRLKSDLPIIARADGPEAVRTLYALGIQEVTSPEFEAAIEMTRQALIHLNVSAHDILRVAGAMRRERYDAPRDKADSEITVRSRIGDIARELDFTWVAVSASSPFNGRRLDELRIRSRFGSSVVGIIRSGSLIANPEGQARLEAEDLVAVLGTRDQIGRFEQAIRGDNRSPSEILTHDSGDAVDG